MALDGTHGVACIEPGNPCSSQNEPEQSPPSGIAWKWSRILLGWSTFGSLCCPFSVLPDIILDKEIFLMRSLTLLTRHPHARFSLLGSANLVEDTYPLNTHRSSFGTLTHEHSVNHRHAVSWNCSMSNKSRQAGSLQHIQGRISMAQRRSRRYSTIRIYRQSLLVCPAACLESWALPLIIWIGSLNRTGIIRGHHGPSHHQLISSLFPCYGVLVRLTNSPRL